MQLDSSLRVASNTAVGGGQSAAVGVVPEPTGRGESEIGDLDVTDPWCDPFLTWAGSKRTLLPEILRRIDEPARRYVEPFAGSACLFFALRPGKAVLADLNPNLIETYETLRAHPRQVARTLRGWSTSSTAYYEQRARDETQLDPVERAARFLYLNRLCFNGLYRTNRAGRFNVPFGDRSGAMPSEGHLYRCSVALRSAELRSGDFEVTVTDCGRGDLIYLDPPYTQRPEKSYGVYGYGSFDARDLKRMISLLERIDATGATFVFSYAAVPELVEELSRRWCVDHVTTRGQIAASVRSRRQRSEILATNRPTRSWTGT